MEIYQLFIYWRTLIAKLHLRRMKMKKCQKLILGVCLVIGLAIVFTGCGSAPTIFDKSVPLEQSSTIIINNYTYVSANINGKPVEWITTSFNKKEVVIPAGEHYFRIGTDTSRLEGIVSVTHNFLPGHIYFVKAYILAGEIYGEIIDFTGLLGEFIPNSGGSNASPLEGTWRTQVLGKTYDLIFSGDQFVTIINGKYQWRGYFAIEGNNVTMPLTSEYYGKKWHIGYTSSYTLRLTYDGESLIGGNQGQTIYRKIE